VRILILFIIVFSSNVFAQPAPPTGPTAAAPTPPPGAFFYYCQATNSYYPNVPTCDAGWIAVPVGQAIPIMPIFRPLPRATEQTVQSQPNSVDLEFFGRALFYSLDYDRAVSAHVTLGIGISSWEAHSWSHDYDGTVTVVPAYANYYFSLNPNRGFVTVGVDWIHVNHAGYNNDTFMNNGFAGVAGGGYEMREHSGLLLRLGGILIAGRTAMVSPLASVGFGF